MRLFPPELEIGPEEGFTPEKDIFGRSEFGARLTRIVSALDGPAVLLLDAPWGSGKTVFVKMWCGKLAKIGVPTVYFDAFKNDYHEDAFLALAGEIIALAREAQPRSARAVKSFKKSAIGVAKVLGRASLHLSVRVGTAGLLSGADVEEAVEAGKETATEASKEIADAIDKVIGERLESHQKDKQAFESFADALKTLAIALAKPSAEGTPTPKGNRPLVFVIDELDRCRPSFALELLEKVKHFFSVPGVVFVLVSSLGQLETAVRFAYGDIDARTYLEKFFHVRLLFPAGTTERSDLGTTTYLRHLLAALPKGDAVAYGDELAQVVAQFSRVHPLSFRTLERICAYMIIVLISTKQNQLRPPPIVAGLCVMKVIAPEEYAAARAEKLTFATANALLRFSEWREQHNPEKRSSLSDHCEKWWRYTLRDLQDERENNRISQALVQYNIDYPPRIVTYLCEIIDGFSFPAVPDAGLLGPR
jgi:hypothetical protein